MASETLSWDPGHLDFLTPYLPPVPISQTTLNSTRDALSLVKPFVTLTYATSLDGMLSVAPGTQTHLSGHETKIMTHFLRAHHQAILIGVGTALADDPKLNCRLEGKGLDVQPIPIILDPKGRWKISEDSRVMKMVKEGTAKAPWILTDLAYVDDARAELLERYGGKVIPLSTEDDDGMVASEGVKFKWEDILQVLSSHGLSSVMVEGGGGVIGDLLVNEEGLVDSVVLTMASKWLGLGGVVASPILAAGASVLKLEEVRWEPMGSDAVMCAKTKK